MIRRLGTFTVHFLNSDTTKQFPTLEAAMAAAAQYVGNHAYTKALPNEPTFLFGPGDGTTSVLIREDIEFFDKEW